MELGSQTFFIDISNTRVSITDAYYGINETMLYVKCNYAIVINRLIANNRYRLKITIF